MKKPRLTAFAATVLLVAASTSQAGIVIQFDYSHDTLNFFTPEKRRVVDQVASIFESNIVNSRTALSGVSIGMADFSAYYTAPQSVPAPTVLSNQSLPADTVRIFMGAADLVGNTLGVATLGTLTGGPGLGFSGWGGSMVFDTGRSYDYLTPYYQQRGLANPYAGAFQAQEWYVDDDIRSAEAQRWVRFSPQGLRHFFSFPEMDFASVVMHELGHVFGLQHSSNPDDAMASALGGERSLFGPLDWFSMFRSGWHPRSLEPYIPAPEPLSNFAIPEPVSLPLVLAALAVAGWAGRRRSAIAQTL